VLYNLVLILGLVTHNSQQLLVCIGLALIRSIPGCPRQGPCTDDLNNK